MKKKIDQSVFTAKTDEEGRFDFKNIPLGEYTFNVIDDDYNPNSFPVSLDSAHLDNFTFGSPITTSLEVSWMFNWGDSGDQENYWSHFTAKIILIIYAFCLVLIFFYSVLQVSLAITYARNRKKKAARFLLKNFGKKW